jgi:hypothetical protein
MEEPDAVETFWMDMLPCLSSPSSRDKYIWCGTCPRFGTLQMAQILFLESFEVHEMQSPWPDGTLGDMLFDLGLCIEEAMKHLPQVKKRNWSSA